MNVFVYICIQRVNLLYELISIIKVIYYSTSYVTINIWLRGHQHVNISALVAPKTDVHVIAMIHVSNIKYLQFPLKYVVIVWGFKVFFICVFLFFCFHLVYLCPIIFSINIHFIFLFIFLILNEMSKFRVYFEYFLY